MSKEATKTDPHLLELGFDPSAPPAIAVAKLREIRKGDRADDPAIARALSAITAPEAAAMLATMEHGATGARRREIRRALFKLHQHGIEAPENSGAVATTVAIADIGLTGLLSPPDAVGARIAWLVKARGSGGVRLLWGVVSETDGLVGVTLETLTRKEYRHERANLEQRAGTQLADADWRLVDFILCDAWRATPEQSRGRVGTFLTLRTELTEETPPTDFHHPIYDEFKDRLEADSSVDLLREPEIGAFKLPEAIVKPYADEVTSLRQSVLVLNRMQQEERVLTVIERALDDLMTGVNADRFRRRLEDTGYFFARTGKRDQAGWAAAAAARLRDHVSLKFIPFFQAFMRAQLGAILSEESEQKREEPRLIMTPAEMMQARQAAQTRMRGRGVR